MSLEHILETLEAEAQAEIAKIEAEASQIREQHIEAIQPRIKSERAYRINAARLAAQRIELEARKSLVDAAFDTAGEELACIRESPMYPALLAALIEEVFNELGQDARLVVDPEDAGLIHELLGHRGTNTEVKPGLDTWGGVIGHSSDGRLSVDNRLETRLEQARDRLHGDVAAVFE